ncbi:MAG: ABC transporter permease [Chloroflexi bacterium]|nr:ABC transporter permease [Chloroflexota bacterium]
MTKNFFQQVALFVLQLMITILVILTTLFFLQRLSGDPAAVLAGHSSSPEVLEAVREDMGLNEPLHVQYAVFMKQALMLDFGESTRFQQPALDMVLDRFPNTLMLAFGALGLAVLVGIPLGTYSAVRHRQMDGMVVNLLAGIMQSLPSFWLGLVLLLIFSIRLKWVGSVANLEDDFLKRMALPTITLSVFYMARLIRLVRSGLIEEMSEQYILTARAKGLRSRTVWFVHAFKNALIPVVAFITLDLSLLIGGSVIVESLFSYSGVGDLMVNAIFNRDYAIVQAGVFVISILVVLINSFSNYLYQAIDPRVGI